MFQTPRHVFGIFREPHRLALFACVEAIEYLQGGEGVDVLAVVFEAASEQLAVRGEVDTYSSSALAPVGIGSETGDTDHHKQD